MISKTPADPNVQWNVTTEPTVEPITVEEVKVFGRIDGNDEDSLLTTLITSVRKSAEDYLGRSLIEQTLVMEMDFWPGEVINLPRPPLLSITEVRTLDEDDTETTYSSSNYYVRTGPTVGQLVMAQNSTWPINTKRYHGGYQIEFKAGYGTAASDVPNEIKEALKLWVMAIYESRTLMPTPPPLALGFLNQHRIIKL